MCNEIIYKLYGVVFISTYGSKNKEIELKRSSKMFNYKILDTTKYISSHKGSIKVLCSEGHVWDTTFHNFKDNKIIVYEIVGHRTYGLNMNN
jgi:hypothetical protein